jgi:hypothetical protein
LHESCREDDDELNAVHFLPAQPVCCISKSYLANDCTDRGGDFDCHFTTGWHSATMRVLPVDQAEHCGGEVDGEDL